MSLIIVLYATNAVNCSGKGKCDYTSGLVISSAEHLPDFEFKVAIEPNNRLLSGKLLVSLSYTAAYLHDKQ